MTTIQLELPEWSAAIDAAWLRIVTSAAKGLNAATTYRRSMVERVSEELVGAAGEMAVAKWRGKFFLPHLNTFHKVADCGGVEVRSTSHASGHLILRDNDPADRRYVLAIVGRDGVTLAGWIQGREGRQPEWRRASRTSDRPAWWVPQESLMAMDSLLERAST